jgi:hypothetical protein
MLNQGITKLRLSSFKATYKTLKTPWHILNFLIYAILYWLEEIYIDTKIKITLDEAIEGYHDELDQQEPDWQDSAIITETESEVDGLPTLQKTADWYNNRQS